MKAASLVRILEYAHGMGFCSVPVDETVYRYYLMALSRWSVVPEQGPLADQVINKLKERQIVPDSVSYGAAIRTHKNTARNPLFAMGRETSITRAVELLEEVSLAHHRSALVSVKAETQNYNDVLEALASSGKAVSKDIAETLVKVMEVSPEGDDIRPNAESYRWLLAVHAHSKAQDKLESARNALERMKATITVKQDADHESEHGKAIVAVYNAFLDVCASVSENQINPTELLQESLEAVEELKSLYSLKPDPRTYANLFEVCKKHIALGAERDRIVESIFESCRNEGLVDSRVLRALKAVTSEELYMELVISHSTVEDGIRMVPESWTTRAVGVQRVVTADGRKAVPLSVDGRFTVTKAMKEYRMRKLRSHVNRNVLHGGRMKLSKKEMGEYIHIKLDEP
jgi:predicted nucleic acid-binding Zn finger protein